MATRQLTETVLFGSAAPRVENGVIYGAKLIGYESRNRRRYKSEALESAITKYEGQKVYVDHPDPENAGRDRGFGDWAGVIENVQHRKGEGLFGDIVLRQESAHFKGIIEAATNEKFRKSCGFSHVAEGESKYEGDTEIIESIKEVFSVDLVTDPATTAGIFESVQKQKSSIRSTLESLPESPQRKRLIEMVDAYLDGGTAAPEGDKQPADYATLCMELITQLGEALKALAMKKDTPAPAPMAPAQPGQTAQQGADDPAKKEDDDKAKSFESLQRENAQLKAKTLLLESGREATEPRIKALAACEGDDQKALLESWPLVARDGELGERPDRSPPALMESVAPLDVTDPKKYAASLR